MFHHYYDCCGKKGYFRHSIGIQLGNFISFSYCGSHFWNSRILNWNFTGTIERNAVVTFLLFKIYIQTRITKIFIIFVRRAVYLGIS